MSAAPSHPSPVPQSAPQPAPYPEPPSELSSAPPGAAPLQAGRIMAGEIAQQPDVLQRILDRGAPAIRAVATAIAARRPRFVLLTARGTSDNAALYAKYLIEVELGSRPG